MTMTMTMTNESRARSTNVESVWYDFGTSDDPGRVFVVNYGPGYVNEFLPGPTGGSLEPGEQTQPDTQPYDWFTPGARRVFLPPWINGSSGEASELR
jgi:hypothetical protein